MSIHWNLPPGVTPKDIDDQYADGEEQEMTERDEWLALAEIWKGAFPVKRGFYGVSVNDAMCLGLCRSIRFLATEHDEKMLKRIPRGDFGYLWPLTLDGAKERVAFCLRMAEECREEEELEYERQKRSKKVQD